jgi:hypothetical protein
MNYAKQAINQSRRCTDTSTTFKDIASVILAVALVVFVVAVMS